MAILQAQAKLYQGFRCYVVDKNISAFLSSSFTMGNRNIPSPVIVDGVFTVYPNAKVSKIIRTIADLFVSPSVGLSNEKLKTFGGGNNVITPGTPRVVDNTNNWKFISELKCKFPTYFRLDIEALGLPEGTDCVIQMEEGFVIEGDYPGSFKSPNPYNPAFTTFRTPKRFYNVQLASAQATLVSIIGFKRFANAGFSTVSTMVPRITYNPGRFASLEMSYFNKVTNARKSVVTGSNMNSQFTFPIGNFRTKLFASEFIQDTATLTQPSNQARLRRVNSPMTSASSQQTEGTKFKGMIDTFNSTFTSSQVGSRFTDTVININGVFPATTNIKVTRNYGIDAYAVSSLYLTKINDYPFEYNYTLGIALGNGRSVKGDGNYVLVHGYAPGTYNINDSGAMYVYDNLGNLISSLSGTYGLGGRADFNNGKIVARQGSYDGNEAIRVFNTSLTQTAIYNKGSGVGPVWNNSQYNIGSYGLTISSSGIIYAVGTEVYNNGTYSYSSGIALRIAANGSLSLVRPPNVNTLGENDWGEHYYQSKNKILTAQYSGSPGIVTFTVRDKANFSVLATFNGTYGQGWGPISENYILLSPPGYTTTGGVRTETFSLYSTSGTFIRNIAIVSTLGGSGVTGYYIDDDYAYFTSDNILKIVRLSDGVTIQRLTDPDGAPNVFGSYTFPSGEKLIYANVGTGQLTKVYKRTA